MHRLIRISGLVIISALTASSVHADSTGGGPHVRVIDGSRAPAHDPHKDWINVNRVATIRWAPGIESRNVKVRGRIRMNAGGEPQHGALQVLKSVDKASPLLARAARTGRPLPKIILTLSQGPQEHHGGTISITNSTVSGYQTKGTAGKAKEKKSKVRPMETLSLNF